MILFFRYHPFFLETSNDCLTVLSVSVADQDIGHSGTGQNNVRFMAFSGPYMVETSCSGEENALVAFCFLPPLEYPESPSIILFFPNHRRVYPLKSRKPTCCSAQNLLPSHSISHEDLVESS